MEQVRMMRCGLCNNRSELRDMRYHKSGDYLICKDCSEKQSPGAKVVVEKQPSSIREVHDVSNKPSDKIGYRCKNCGYSFSRTREHNVFVCPYCGKESISILERGAAQNLIDTAQE